MQYLIGLFIGIGLFMILADYFRVPYFATSPCGCPVTSN